MFANGNELQEEVQQHQSQCKEHRLQTEKVHVDLHFETKFSKRIVIETLLTRQT